MKVRAATYGDIIAIVEIAVHAFSEEPIYAHFYPYRSRYPNDYRKSLERSYRLMLESPGQLVIVGESESGDLTADHNQSESPMVGFVPQIIGFATFIRFGSEPEMDSWNGASWRKTLMRFWMNLQSYIDTDRSICQDTVTDYYRQAAEIRAMPKESSFLEFKTLAVHPSFQRRGFGEQLVVSCGMRAIEEGIPVFGDASAQGLPLYVRNGCKEIGKIKIRERAVPGTSDGKVDSQVLDAMEVVVLRWDASSIGM